MGSQTNMERCVNLRRGGLTIEQIARELRCSIKEVQEWLRGAAQPQPPERGEG